MECGDVQQPIRLVKWESAIDRLTHYLSTETNLYHPCRSIDKEIITGEVIFPSLSHSNHTALLQLLLFYFCSE